MLAIDRAMRTLGAAGAALASLLLLQGCSLNGTREQAVLSPPTNAKFYLEDGSFDVRAAKQAYYQMMEFYNYPIPERLRGDDFWTLDFGLGQFDEVGMAGIFWINNHDHDYLGHEIFLRPGPMIPRLGDPVLRRPARTRPPDPAAPPGRGGGPQGHRTAAGRGRVPGPAAGETLDVGGRSGRHRDRVRLLPRHGRAALLAPQMQTLRSALTF